MLFGSKQPRPTLDQSLAATPVRTAGATLTPGAGGGGRVAVPLRPARWAGWLFRTPEGATKTFELDEMGVLVWTKCDGNHSVEQIVRALAARYSLSEREAMVATAHFLNTLVRKGLMGVAIERPKSAGRKADGGRSGGSGRQRHK